MAHRPVGIPVHAPARVRRAGPSRVHRPGGATSPNAVRREPRPDPARTRGSRNLTGRAAVVLLVLGALIVSYAQSLRVWFDQHQQITALQQEIRDREKRVGELNDEIARWDDDAYVKAQARQRLGWVMPGEVGYRVIGADGKPVGAPPEPSTPSDAYGRHRRSRPGTPSCGGASREPATRRPVDPDPGQADPEADPDAIS